MKTNRRAFLKVGVAASSLISVTSVGNSRAGESNPAFEMPRGFTLVNMRVRGELRLGAKLPQGIFDVTAAGQALNLPVPTDMDDLLHNGKGGQLKAVVAQAERRSLEGVFLKEESISYAPVVTRPEKIIMMGFNYRKHAEETNTPIPKNPPLFNKYNNALNHHGGTIKLPTRAASNFDYEVELVIVIGKDAHNVSEADALDYVAGYCTGNDFTARDLQYLTSQFMLGKSADGFGPIGPYLVTSDLVGDPNKLRLETRVNGEQRQDWNTNDMIFNCRQLISFASKVMTLKPGDIFFTGTPQGVIYGKPKDERVWLKPGDEVACSVEKLGELRFRLV